MERNGHTLDAKVAFELGWDIASYGLGQPVLLNDALVAGYAEARLRRNRKPAVADRFVRKWLQLRVNAWLRHRVVDETVTPDYLRRIDAKHCYVMGTPLTHGTGAPTDWSVDRLNNEGAYAPGNLVVISTGANKAKGRKTFAAVLSLVDAPEQDTSELTSEQWSRLAALMAVPCNITKTHLPLLPYPLIPPVGVPLAFEQNLQWTLVSQCKGGPKTVIGRMKAACDTPQRKIQFHQLIQKVRRKSEKLAVYVDVWLNPTLWATFEDFVVLMSPAELQRFQALLTPANAKWDPKLLDAWQLDCGGYMPSFQPPTEARVVQGIGRGCDEAAGDSVARALDERGPLDFDLDLDLDLGSVDDEGTAPTAPRLAD